MRLNYSLLFPLPQPSISSLFGSPPRQKINVDDWVREGEGKYTREAVLMFEEVQSEAEVGVFFVDSLQFHRVWYLSSLQKLRQQKLSASGGIEVVNLGGKYEIKTSFWCIYDCFNLQRLQSIYNLQLHEAPVTL